MPGLIATLQALTVPFGQNFPGDPQSFLNFIAAYMQINGLSTFNGINYGPNTPGPSGQGFPWFKTDNSFNPIGWFTWNGSAWVELPIVPASGSTADRPSSPINYQQYFDTDINTLITWYNSAWHTVDGSPGDIKFVRGTNITTILAANPGWVQVTDMAACIPGVAGDGTGSGFSNRAADSGYPIGEENHLLSADEMPSHTHTVNQYGNLIGTAGANPIWANVNSVQSGTAGGGLVHNNMPPAWFLYCLQKS